MLPKKNRLVTRGDFKGVFRGGLRARSGPFQLMCQKNKTNNARFGFIVPLSVSKKAVRRNKLRRQMHEFIRMMIFQKISGYDCVIRAYPGADELQYDEMGQYIMEMIKKAGIL